MIMGWFLSLAATGQTVIWSANMETADLSQWTINGTKGGSYDSGTCIRPNYGVTTEKAHSGAFSMKMTIDTTVQESGCRQFRHQESVTGNTYYYGAWFFIPANTKATNYWNIFQFKSQTSTRNDPFWVIDLMPRKSTGSLRLLLRWKGTVVGPYSTDSKTGTKYYDQGLVDAPVGKWFHIQAYLVQSSYFTGHLVIWQDGVKIYDMVNVKTKYVGGDERWSVNNYSDKVSPTPATLFVDDATVSTGLLVP